ncbi:hypothetical protein H4R34_001975 [Dimargaris verticillata]|uniref:Uncharacterized protein n=1 Tax=Dimargaris verticillata TaxID=2761393 RepID=A0A9W8B8W3_9FUNG|nr:hypothetical protein H4R34_001975 [Dimargaris verticillata]
MKTRRQTQKRTASPAQTPSPRNAEPALVPSTTASTEHTPLRSSLVSPERSNRSRAASTGSKSLRVSFAGTPAPGSAPGADDPFGFLQAEAIYQQQLQTHSPTVTPTKASGGRVTLDIGQGISPIRQTRRATRRSISPTQTPSPKRGVSLPTTPRTSPPTKARLSPSRKSSSGTPLRRSTRLRHQVKQLPVSTPNKVGLPPSLSSSSSPVSSPSPPPRLGSIFTDERLLATLEKYDKLLKYDPSKVDAIPARRRSQENLKKSATKPPKARAQPAKRAAPRSAVGTRQSQRRLSNVSDQTDDSDHHLNAGDAESAQAQALKSKVKQYFDEVDAFQLAEEMVP